MTILVRNVKIIFVLWFQTNRKLELFSFWSKILQNIVACFVEKLILRCRCLVLYWLYAVEISIPLVSMTEFCLAYLALHWCKFSDLIKWFWKQAGVHPINRKFAHPPFPPGKIPSVNSPYTKYLLTPSPPPKVNSPH